MLMTQRTAQPSNFLSQIEGFSWSGSMSLKGRTPSTSKFLTLASAILVKSCLARLLPVLKLVAQQKAYQQPACLPKLMLASIILPRIRLPKCSFLIATPQMSITTPFWPRIGWISGSVLLRRYSQSFIIGLIKFLFPFIKRSQKPLGTYCKSLATLTPTNSSFLSASKHPTEIPLFIESSEKIPQKLRHIFCFQGLS